MLMANASRSDRLDIKTAQKDKADSDASKKDLPQRHPLLSPNNSAQPILATISTLVPNRNRSHQPTQLTRSRIPRNNSNIRRSLPTNSRQSPRH
jgi:hypothetical protein